jgi:hypothetical protein
MLRTLQLRAFEFARFCGWYLLFFLPGAVTSWFVKRTPEVYGFDGTGQLVSQLRRVNARAPTKMCRVMTKHGSDKGRRWHNYTTVYSTLFNGCRDRPLRIFELGLGTNNPDLASSMGITGRPGASLRGWRELFPHALVYGADIDHAILFQEDRIKTFYCDQLDRAAIRELWLQPDLQDGMDIIIEDGLHTFEANISFLEGSLEHLRPGGTYVIEDIAQETIDRWCDQIKTIYSKRYPAHEFALVTLPNPLNRVDNNLLIIRRASPETRKKPLTRYGRSG